ncbi:protein of unknown function (plasmid) [Vibrio harveyi]|nr:protein of unknown function [Vibrio harveyi]
MLNDHGINHSNTAIFITYSDVDVIYNIGIFLCLDLRADSKHY